MAKSILALEMATGGQKHQDGTGKLIVSGVLELEVLEAGSSRSRCWQGWFLLRARRENVFWFSLAYTWLPPAHLPPQVIGLGEPCGSETS